MINNNDNNNDNNNYKWLIMIITIMISWLNPSCSISKPKPGTHFFYRQIDFSSEPGAANEILENEAKSCLVL